MRGGGGDQEKKIGNCGGGGGHAQDRIQKIIMTEAMSMVKFSS